LKIEQGVALARFTTIGTGGPARAFARPGSLDQLAEALAWARANDVSVATVGLGSNLLVADDGVDSLVLKLGGDLAAARTEDDLLVAGGGAANAVCLHRARAADLGGFEFACAIPGTIGGGVWMNAGAYGGDWAGVLVRALVVDSDGAHWRTPDQLGLRYRHSDLRHGEVVASVEFQLEPRPGDEIKAIVADLQQQRKAAQPTNKRTYGSVFKNPDRRCPDLAAARELHRERRRSAHERRRRPDGGGPSPGPGPVRRRARARGRVPGPAGAAAAVGALRVAAKSAAWPHPSSRCRGEGRRCCCACFHPAGRCSLPPLSC